LHKNKKGSQVNSLPLVCKLIFCCLL